MSIKIPRLIRDKCGVYYFRWIVPLHLREQIGKTELRKSLRTKEPQIANSRALELSLQLGNILKPKLSDFADLLNAPDRVDKMLVADFQEGRFHADTPEELAQLKQLIDIVGSGTIKPTGNSSKLRPAPLWATMPVAKIGVGLQECSQGFITTQSKTLRSSSAKKLKTVMNKFLEHYGDIDVGLIRNEDFANNYKIPILEKMEPSTVNDHLKVLTDFFEWMNTHKNARLPSPWEALKFDKPRRNSQSYDVFSPKELQTIFNPTFYLKKMKKPDHYWCPLIAAFTGGRIGEIAGLKIAEIDEEVGIPYLHLSAITPGKSENAKRKVPIHPRLIELGFLDYLAKVRAAGHTRLFDYLPTTHNAEKKNSSRQFSLLLRSEEVNIQDARKVTHSFRHTFVTELTSLGVNEGIKRALAGHALSRARDAHGVYTHTDKLTLTSILKNGLAKLDFPLDYKNLRVDQQQLFSIAAQGRKKWLFNKARKNVTLENQQGT